LALQSVHVLAPFSGLQSVHDLLDTMPSSIASESGTSARRIADMSAKHRQDAMTKFPNGYDAHAKHHYATLKATNKNKPCKPGTFDHFLLLTFFPEIKKDVETADKHSKSPIKNAGKSSDADKAAAAQSKQRRPSVDSAADSASSSSEDESVRQVPSHSAAQDLEKRAAADDAPAAPALSEIVTDPHRRPVVDMDADVLLGSDLPNEDTPENNAKIAEDAAAHRGSKNRMSAALLKAAKDRRASAGDEMQSGRTARKRSRRSDDSDSSSGEQASRTKKSRKPERKSREPVAVDSETEGDDDVSERKSRFTRRADSNLLVQFAHEVDKLRPFVQRMLLQRDGAELREGSTHRNLNFHAILSVAGTRMSRENFKAFKKACNESHEDLHDK